MICFCLCHFVYLAFASTFKCYFNYLNKWLICLVGSFTFALPSSIWLQRKGGNCGKIIVNIRLLVWYCVFPIYTYISTCWAQPNLCGWIEYKINFSTYKYLDFHFIYCYYCHYTIPTVQWKLIDPWGE